MEFFDTHSHLDDEQFDNLRDEVFERANDAEVHNIIVVGTTVDASKKCIDIAKAYPSASAAVGIQPNYCKDVPDHDFQTIVDFTKDSNVVAIGETGLDRYWDYCPFEIQQNFFRRHVKLSLETNLPFIVHMRDCGQEIVDLLNEFSANNQLNGVMHSFSGDWELAEKCLDLGLYISFAGMVTYKKSNALREVARQVPSDRILIETDAPYLSPHPKRGQRPNEPALVIHTAKCLAEVRNVSLEDFARTSTENAKRLFQK